MVKKVSPGVVHEIPKDLNNFILSFPEIYQIWESITPLARNEWICWFMSAKKEETKIKRLEWMKSYLLKGKHRPCCWPGCKHRE